MKLEVRSFVYLWLSLHYMCLVTHQYVQIVLIFVFNTKKVNDINDMKD